jgi:hypothetical protein
VVVLQYIKIDEEVLLVLMLKGLSVCVPLRKMDTSKILALIGQLALTENITWKGEVN